jgi:hypothetical protein
MTHRVIRTFLLFPVLAVLVSPVAKADLLRLEISDPVGDAFNTGTVDLANLILDFNNVTGAYSIRVEASAAHPFSGGVRLNIHFLNPDTGLGISSNAMLIDSVNDFSLSAATTSLVLTGVSSNLTLWEAGDRVAINSIPFGIPSNLGLSFNSGVLAGTFPFLQGTDLFGSPGGANFSTLTVAPAAAVPEPASGLLFAAGSCLLAAGLHSRRRPDGQSAVPSSPGTTSQAQ